LPGVLPETPLDGVLGGSDGQGSGGSGSSSGSDDDGSDEGGDGPSGELPPVARAAGRGRHRR